MVTNLYYRVTVSVTVFKMVPSFSGVSRLAKNSLTGSRRSAILNLWGALYVLLALRALHPLRLARGAFCLLLWKVSPVVREQREKPNVSFDKDGVAIGWIMAVGACFRSQLDIKLNTLVRSRNEKNSHLSENEFLSLLNKSLDVVDYHIERHTNGSEKKWLVRAWTQGKEYSFDRGHSISGRQGKITEKLTLQVLEASPSNSNIHDEGKVTFLIYYAGNGPNHAQTPIGLGSLTQVEFVEFLKKASPAIRVFSGYDSMGKFYEVKPIQDLQEKKLCLFES